MSVTGQIFSTGSSTYLLNYPAMTCTRYPGVVLTPTWYDATPVHALPGDWEEVTLLEMPHPVLGEPCELVLQAVDGAVGSRSTSPVTFIERIQAFSDGDPLGEQGRAS